VRVPGEVLILSHPASHRPAEFDLGVLGADVEGIALTAERIASPAFVRILSDGTPLRRTSLFVLDLSLKGGDVQPSGAVETDAEARISTDWLQRGRRYYLRHGERNGQVVWSEQETLDLARDLRPVSELPRR